MGERRSLILGTAGHIDHGKTSLVRALTGIDTDRLPAEKQRGITIDLGFAPLDLGEVSRGALVKRAAPALAGLAGVGLLALLVGASRRPSFSVKLEIRKR